MIDNYPLKRYLQTKELFFKKNIYRKIRCVGVVGSCGKTTTALYIYNVLKNCKKDVMYIGTHYLYYKDLKIKTNNTTLEAKEFINIFDKNKLMPKYIIMEISSHAINEARVNFLKFKCLIFTNLGNEHLDYHLNINNYFNVKKSIFLSLNKCKKIINIDDENGKKIAKACKKVIKVSKKDFKIIKDIKCLEFNKYNLIEAFKALKLFHIRNIINKLKDIKLSNGRGEVLFINNYNFIIDYAHTPEAFKAILNDNIKNKIVVFGCGGNRDRNKRKIIGEIVDKYSLIGIVTEDNNRNEDIINIKNDITLNMKKYIFIKDRKEAIKFAINIANNKKDYIYILGKGDESFLEKENKKIEHNDKDFIINYFR